ncbi:MAG: glycoside hydrolase family 9 protein [Fimbriimonadaceae bacterium]|nr:glycoside hydrolase family 9 protein [Fimbriimonadaceae bacterium]
MVAPLFALTAACALASVSACAPQTTSYPSFAVPRLDGVTIAGLPAVTGRIHVDQFGYLPGQSKVAVITDPVTGYNAGDAYTPGNVLEVKRRKDGKTVLRGPAKAWKAGAVHEDSGDRGWWFDFSPLKEKGEFYVFDPSTKRRSPLFRIGDDVYRDVLRAAVKTYFYQRLSWRFEAPSAEKPWLLPSYMDQDRKARALWAKNDPSTERDLSGGWMDAGDTNKYPPFNADVLSSLLYAYRDNPKAFTDDFGIPESGNGLPDLLDEVKYQYDWLVKMQDADGGVFVKMGDVDNSGPTRPRYYGPKCTGATITTVMNFAHAARVYSRFPKWKAFADGLRARAEKGWRYYHSHPQTVRSDTGEIRAGNASRSAEDQDRLEGMAGIHLFALTGKKEYHDAVLKQAGKTRQLSEGIWSPYETGMTEALTDYLSLPNADPALCGRIRRQLRDSARNDRFSPSAEADLYRAWMNPEAYHWGSNTVRASFGFGALLAAQHGGVAPEDRERLRTRASDLLHSFHGVNPFSAVLLTNMERYGAALSMKRIWHERFNYDTPFAANPPPGYVVGGANQSYGGSKGNRAGEVDWIRTQPRAKAYADFNEPWPMNSWELTENAIYYQAAYVRLLAGVMKAR